MASQKEKNRTLVEMTRCMMRQAGSPPHLWAEAVNTANYIGNRCPTTALNGGIPFTLWKGKIPTLAYFQVFGAKAFVLNKTQGRGKLDSRSEPGIFVGYAQTSKAYRIYMPKTRSVVISRDVKFVVSGFTGEYKEILEESEKENFSTETEDTPKEEELKIAEIEFDRIPTNPQASSNTVMGTCRTASQTGPRTAENNPYRIERKTTKNIF